jgi:hypothetical protein
MDPVTTAIVAALSAGAATGISNTAKKSITDAYEGVKRIITKRFGSETAKAIDNLEAEPNSLERRKALERALHAVNATTEAELLLAAQGLVQMIKAMPQGERHIQMAHGNGIAQADRGGTASVTIYGSEKEKKTKE